ncbi:hypothetical protein C5612_21695 [Pseudomonas frederiksbergensis]|uniref:Uncharacterized protein n=1 Tax=Pseudomonas frederiksbergensis TaxID=104087 RepID=A0A2S8HDK4_9PSED|nr:hypothetical protein C5612_21695 [Pseudomonas frederiksbergensis]
MGFKGIARIDGSDYALATTLHNQVTQDTWLVIIRDPSITKGHVKRTVILDAQPESSSCITDVTSRDDISI